MIYEENRVRRGKTLWSNVLSGATGTPKNIAAYFELIKDFRPELTVSDFESWTYLYAKLHRLPILSVDNMQIINRCTHDAEILAGHEAGFQLTRVREEQAAVLQPLRHRHVLPTSPLRSASRRRR